MNKTDKKRENSVKNQNKLNLALLILLAISLLMFFATLVYCCFQNKKSLSDSGGIENIKYGDSSTSVKSPTSVFTEKYEFGADIEKSFNDVSNIYQGNVLSDIEASVWWVGDDGLNIMNDKETGLVYKNYDCNNFSSPDDTLFSKIVSTLSTDIKEIMESYDYVLNYKNSSKSLEDPHFYDYIQAYEKGTSKCVFKANPDCVAFSETEPFYNSFSFTCTESYDNNYTEQSQYLRDLNIKDAIISVSKKVDDYALINVNYRRAGHFVIAKLVDGKWVEIYSGQDYPRCDLMEENQVPEEIYGECISD